MLEQMGQLFLMMCVGFLLAKRNLLDTHTKQQLAKLTLQVATPFMVLDAFQDRMSLAESQTDSLSIPYLFLASFAFYLVLIVLTLPLVLCLPVSKQDKRLYTFMTIFGNVGFMGFPVALAVCGTEGLFYSAILNCVFNLLVYTFGILLMTWNSEHREGTVLSAIPWKKLLTTPAVICSMIAVLLFALHIKLPSILANTADTLGGLTSPLAMLVVGANLTAMPLRNLFRNPVLNVYVLLRQFALPLLAWLLFRLFIDDALLLQVWLLMACMPIANTTALFATEYHGDERLASQSIFLTTLLSLISMPILVWICR